MQAEAHTSCTVADAHDRVRLVGGRCVSCVNTTFPLQHTCARCGSKMVAETLPAEGALWSWTVQRIAPKPPYAGPLPFEPFAVGYVDLGELKVETPLFGREPAAWQIGEPVVLCCGVERPHLQFWFEPKAAGR